MYHDCQAFKKLAPGNLITDTLPLLPQKEVAAATMMVVVTAHGETMTAWRSTMSIAFLFALVWGLGWGAALKLVGPALGPVVSVQYWKKRKHPASSC